MIYFDNAATSFPKPDAVPAELMRCLNHYCGNPGRSAHRLSIESSRKLYECRERLARLFGYDRPENITFTYNATYALNMAIKSRVRAGAHVLISDLEHNSVLRPVHRLFLDGVITYDVFSSNGPPAAVLGSIKRLLRPNTVLLVCNHVSNICTRRLPLRQIAALCSERGIACVCDASQGAGTLEYRLDGSGISALCAPAHKGLYGVQGVGFSINCDGAAGSTLIEGGGGVDSLDRKMPEFLPDRLEAGTANTPGIAALCAALQWLEQVTTEAIREHENGLRLYCLERMAEMKHIILYGADDEEGGTMLFNAEGLTSDLVGGYLSDSGVCVRSGYHCSPLAHRTLDTREDGAVRVSFGYFNTRRETEHFLRLVDGLK